MPNQPNHSATIQVPLTDLTVDPAINLRPLDDETVERYTAIFDQLPPVAVFRLPAGVQLLAGGFHRFEAARRLGRETIGVVYHTGTRLDAEEFAVLDNVAHGRPYTRAERRQAAERLIQLHANWANNRLADLLGMSKNTIETIRAELEAGCQIDTLGELEGADGKKYPRRLSEAGASSGEDDGAEEAEDEDGEASVGRSAARSKSGAARGHGAGADEGEDDELGDDEDSEGEDDRRQPATLFDEQPDEATPVDIPLMPVGVTPTGQWAVYLDNVLTWQRPTNDLYHALICDAPYHLENGFMGADWDKGEEAGIAFRSETWRKLSDHIQPGGFVVSCASSRGWHRLAAAMEDAGLILHPTIWLWNYASGFPKATRIDATSQLGYRPTVSSDGKDGVPITAPATSLAEAWVGHRYGRQALKPAIEPIIIAQKPYDGKPVESITQTGAGALWIDGARIPVNPTVDDPRLGGQGDRATDQAAQRANGQFAGDHIASSPRGRWPANFVLSHTPDCTCTGSKKVKAAASAPVMSPPGQKTVGIYGQYAAHGDNGASYYADADGQETIETWNCLRVCDDCGQQWSAVSKAACPQCQSAQTRWLCPVALLDEQSGPTTRGHWSGIPARGGGVYQYGLKPNGDGGTATDEGGASRFFFRADWSREAAEMAAIGDQVFYSPKASSRERDAMIEPLYWRLTEGGFEALDQAGYERLCAEEDRQEAETGKRPLRCVSGNIHIAVKPIKLMQWVATLLLPPASYAPRRLLVPFSGSGSEMIGGFLAGWEVVHGIENEPNHVRIANRRLPWWAARAGTGAAEQVNGADAVEAELELSEVEA